MTKLEILQAELIRLNVEMMTDVGETLRQKHRRINVIIGAIARLTSSTAVLNGSVVTVTIGRDGKDGTTTTTGTALPANSFGRDGDIFINTTDWNVSEKENGVW